MRELQAVPRVSPLVTSLLQKAAESLHEVDEVRRAHDRIKHPAKIAASGLDAVSEGKAGLSLGEVASMASALLPFINEPGSLIETTVIEKKERERREERVAVNSPRRSPASPVMRPPKRARNYAILWRLAGPDQGGSRRHRVRGRRHGEEVSGVGRSPRARRSAGRHDADPK